RRPQSRSEKLRARPARLTDARTRVQMQRATQARAIASAPVNEPTAKRSTPTPSAIRSTDFASFDKREGADGECAHAFDFDGHGEELAAMRGQRREVAEMFDNRNVGAQQERVRGPRQIGRVVNVERVNADEARARS